MEPEQEGRNGDEDEIEDVSTQIYRPEDEIEDVTQVNRAVRDKVSSSRLAATLKARLTHLSIRLRRLAFRPRRPTRRSAKTSSAKTAFYPASRLSKIAL